MPTTQLSPGAIHIQHGTPFIVEEGLDEDGEVLVGELGSRKVPERLMFSLGECCPIPSCDGTVTEGETAQHRQCSAGCLVWKRNYPVEGADCPDHSCDEGSVILKDGTQGQYVRRCTDCEVYAFGPIKWREAWNSDIKQVVIDNHQ